MNYFYYYFPEIEKLKNCKICSTEEKKYLILPSGHYGLGQGCFDKKDYYKGKCPYCKKKVTGYVNVYNP